MSIYFLHNLNSKKLSVSLCFIFIKTFPEIKILAQSSEEQVMSLWSGLGYYSRARNIHKTAKIILNEYKGKFILFVNVASNCGFTRQYKDLQQLYNENSDRLVVIGVPCNQFGAQEPGTEEQISIFCSEKYDVTFPMTEKIYVRGSNQHQLYKWLTSKEFNGRKSSSVKWNFQKYLVDKDGNLIDYWYSLTSPMSSKITNYIK